MILYHAEVVGGMLQAGDDAQKVAWFTMNDLPEIAFQSTQVIIERWQNGRL